MISVVREAQITFTGDQQRPCGRRCIKLQYVGLRERCAWQKEQTGTGTEAEKYRA